jgi:hypothetical protein
VGLERTKLGKKLSEAIEARRFALGFVIRWCDCMYILLNVGDSDDEGCNKKQVTFSLRNGMCSKFNTLV